MMYDPEYHESSHATTIPANRRANPGTVRRSGIVQIVFGIAMFIIGVAAIASGMAGLMEPMYSSIGAGMWGGMVVVFAGITGVVAIRRGTQAWYIASIVMACVSILCCVMVMAISTASLNAALNPGMNNRTQNATPRPFTTPIVTTQSATQTPEEKHYKNMRLAVVDAAGIVVALATLITAATQAISSYQLRPFGLSTMIFVIGHPLLGCCRMKQSEESTAGYAREEDFSTDDPYGDLGT